MNSVTIGSFKNKFLTIIAAKYINGSLALSIVDGNHVEYADITYYVKEHKLSDFNYFFINPKLDENLKKLLIKKNIILCSNKFYEIGNQRLEVDMINPKISRKFDFNCEIA